MSESAEPGPVYEIAFNGAPGNYLLLAPDFTIVGVTDAYLRATMTRRDEILGRGLFEVFPDNPDDPAADGVRNLRASLQRVVAQRKPDRMAVQKYDIRRPQAEGGGFEERYWSPLNTPVLDQDGALRYIIHWVEDVTEFVRLKEAMRQEQALMHEELRARASRIEAEAFLRIEAVEANQQLTESERRYRFLADAVPQLIWTADPDGQVDYCNARWLGFTDLSLEQLRGNGWQRILHPDEVERIRSSWSEAVHAGVDRFQLEHRLRYSDGTWRWMLTTALPFRDADGAVAKWLGSTTDINEQVTAREQLLQAQRLQAVGKLAGGMAHEVNNMMTVVLGLGDLIRTGLAPQHPQRPDLDEMLRAATRAVEVTRQLLAFSRQQVLKPVVLDVNLVVSELGHALEQLVGSARRLEIVAAVPLLRIRADRTQVEQVLINLVANARDATTTDGVIVVRADRVQVEETELCTGRESEAEPGSFVRLVVEDNGAGMPPETLARAFEPFFTTKGVGQGTGLGLSMVYGIVRQSGGFLRIDSTPGAGTVVAVHFPLVDAEPSLPETLRKVPRSRGETLLVVEDESVVRSLASRVLQAAGYKLYQAPNGAVALEFLRAHPDEVDLVLTDIVMPRMTGRELEASIREEWPGLPVLFMSGYVGGQSVEGESTLEGVPLIRKPFTPRALEAVVLERLDLARRGLRTP